MLYVLALFVPPLACLFAGKPGAAILNIFLCLFFWLPGVVHAFVVVAGAGADKRTDRMIRVMQATQQPPPQR